MEVQQIPAARWNLPGHKYTGPYNDLENQVRYNPETGEILEIYDPPTGPTDNRKMVKSLDAVPYNERQWGHWLARNLINTKQKLKLALN